MRNALRKEVFPIDVAFTPSSSSLDHSSNHSIAVRKGKEWHVRLREKVDMVVTVRNECGESPLFRDCHDVLYACLQRLQNLL